MQDRPRVVLLGSGLHEAFLSELHAQIADCARSEARLARDPRVETIGLLLAFAFSPHDLRHRRASLWHLGGVPAAQAAAWLGHSAVEHVRTYAHVVLDRREVDYVMLMRARAVAHPWHTAAEKVPVSSMV